MSPDITLWLESGLGYAQAAVTAAGTLLTVGLAFLARPGRATLLWSCAFALAMVAMFSLLSGELNGIEPYRRFSLGVLLGVPPLLWAGFRAWWGLHSVVWPAIALATANAVVFVVAPDEVFLLVYRIAFAVTALFPTLLFIDWLRAGTRRDPFTIPVAVLSLAYPALAVAALVSLLLPESASASTAETMRILSGVGMVLYTASAVVAVLGVSLRGTSRTARSDEEDARWERFSALASARLREAQNQNLGGAPLSMVCLRLDDIEDIRRAVGPRVTADLQARFAATVREVFSDDLDPASPERGAMIVLTSHGDAAVRELLRTTLQRVAEGDDCTPTRPSASIGWAPAHTVGYDFVTLVYLAREAAELASQRGGDRWERVNATVGQMLLSRSERL